MITSEILILRAKLSDLVEILQLFKDTVHAICKSDYYVEEINSWTSSVQHTQGWTDKINLHYFLVADLDTEIIGFVYLDNNDTVDLLYVHKNYQRQGIANKLYDELERKAVAENVTILYSNVSKTAVPFFDKMGYKVLVEQKNNRQGIEMVNYKMAKHVLH